MYLCGARIEIEFFDILGFLLQRILVLIIKILSVVSVIDLGRCLKQGRDGSLNSRELGL